MRVRLIVEGLRAGYGALEILHGVSLDTGGEAVTAILGPNGSGKSTLLKAVVGVLPPWGGSVRFDGVDLTGLPPHRIVRQGVTTLPQGGGIFPRLTVQENLLMGAYVLDDGQAVRTRLAEIFARFPVLAERRRQAAGSLSGGQQMLLAVGRALMTRPRLMILDEPSAGLAPRLVAEVFDLIRGLAVEEGMAFLLVEQSVRQALRVADRCVVLVQGEVRFAGGPSGLSGEGQLMDLYFGRRA
ncbi:MAG: ABC transporter ATP-binding protein [candidate division NC10 bacterium]|nr:ABC transporter ATP-binding protein [candidate division NC10 bacterium]